MTATILIIEDDDWFAQQQARVLERTGYTTRRASNGLDGIDAIDAHKPSVIILDIFLPGPNALVLLHELQSHADLAKIPIIVCTNSTDQLMVGSLAAYGITQVIDKTGMLPEDLVAAVKRELL